MEVDEGELQDLYSWVREQRTKQVYSTDAISRLDLRRSMTYPCQDPSGILPGILVTEVCAGGRASLEKREQD